MCNRARATVWYTFCRPSKSAPTMPVFCDLYVKPSSRYSLVRISQTSSSKTVPIRQFFSILNCKSSSRCRSCTFCRHHLQKVFRTWHFFNIFKCKSSCLYSPVRFLSTTLPDRTQEPQKTETLLQRPRKPLYPKKQGFAPESVFTRGFTRSQTVTLLYGSHTWTALAHHVFDMMMLTWRWHDAKTAPGRSSVARKFSNETSFEQ